MPWKKNKGGGFRTAKGGNIKNTKQYEALRKKGMSRKKAARISNKKK
jgi:hypothetical protein